MNQQKHGPPRLLPSPGGAPSSRTAAGAASRRFDDHGPPRGSCATAQWAAVWYEVPIFAWGFTIPARNNEKVFLPLLAKIPPQTLPGAPSVFLA